MDTLHLQCLSISVFAIAMAGIIINTRNLIKLFLCIELMFLAVSINFVTFAHAWGKVDGHIFTVFLLTVAAAESAVGLGILVFYFRQRATVSVADDNVLKD